MASLIPGSFGLVALLVWLGVGIIGAALAGVVANVIARDRSRSVGPGLLAGFVTAGFVLGISNPDGGRWWVMWAAAGSVMGAVAGAVAWKLLEKMLEHWNRAAPAS